MDPNPKSFPILSYVMARLPSLGPRPAAPTSEFDLEQQPTPHSKPPSDPSSSSGQVRIEDDMPHLTHPGVLASMTRAISDVAQTRSVLYTLGPRPDHEAVDNARSKLAEIEANLAKQLEEIVLSPRPADVDRLQWRSHLAEREDDYRRSADKEKLAFKAVLAVDEMHDAYEKLLKEAEERLEKIYETAQTTAGEYSPEDEFPPQTEEPNEEVIGILQAASGQGLEQVDLSGRRLRFLPEAFGRIRSLVVLDISSNQLEVILLFSCYNNFVVILDVRAWTLQILVVVCFIQQDLTLLDGQDVYFYFLLYF